MDQKLAEARARDAAMRAGYRAFAAVARVADRVMDSIMGDCATIEAAEAAAAERRWIS